MGKLETRLVEHEVVHQQQIEVDRTRAVARPFADPSELALDVEQRREKLCRCERRLERHGRVEELRLVEVADRIGLPECRYRDDVDARPRVEQVDRTLERRRTIAEIRSEPYV